MNRIYFTLLLLLAQTLYSQEEIIEPYVGEVTESELILLADDISDLIEARFNINQATKEKLELLPFLTDNQIENILYYLYTSGPLLSIYELQLVEDLDRNTIEQLLPYIFVAPLPDRSYDYKWRDYLSSSKSKIYIQSSIPFELKDGYRGKTDSLLALNKKYLGDPFTFDVRFEFKSLDRVEAGLRANKGAGESFSKGFDYYSVFLMIKDIGILKRAIIGDYKLSFGEGLVLSHNFSFGKNSNITTSRRRQTPIRGSISSESTTFFRGASMMFDIYNSDLSLFYSERRLDANITDSTITSVIYSGKHRTLKEWERKNNISITNLGANYSLFLGCIRLGSTFLYERYSKPILPKESEANRFIFKGEDNFNLSLDYSYSNNKLSFQGEAAISKSKGYATLNRFIAEPTRGVTLSLIQRYYSVDYHANNAKAFNSGGKIQNEEGYFLSYQVESIRRWRISGYIDFFRFPWLRSNADAPSSGWEYQNRLEFIPSKMMQFRLNYKHSEKEINSNSEDEDLDQLVFGKRDRFRLDNYWFPNEEQRVRLGMEYALNNRDDRGYSIGVTYDNKPTKSPLNLSFSILYFNSNSSLLRMSSNEKSMLYSFYTPSLFGRGVRGAIQLRYNINTKFYLLAKYGATIYNDRLEIGSGLERVSGRHVQDISILLRIAT